MSTAFDDRFLGFADFFLPFFGFVSFFAATEGGGRWGGSLVSW
jgi:hypothetical protein